MTGLETREQGRTVSEGPPPSQPTGSSRDRRATNRGPDRRRTFSWRSQLRVLVPLFIVWLGGFGVLGAVVAHGDVSSLFLDPAYLNGGVWYNGLVSQLGVMAWTVAAVSAAWSAWIANASGRTSAARFLFVASIVGTILLLDDLFGFHSTAPSFGIPKIIGELIIVAPLAGWLLRYWPDIARTRYPILLAALGANGVSVVVDGLFHPANTDIGLLFEDGAKFLGILAWATYFVLTTCDIARSAMASRLAKPRPTAMSGASSAAPVPERDRRQSPRSGQTVSAGSAEWHPLWVNESNEFKPSWITSNDGN